jgi:prevent-host-death family protein
MGKEQTVDSSKVKYQFGVILERALKGEVTVVERYGREAAVVMSAEEYRRLTAGETQRAS